MPKDQQKVGVTPKGAVALVEYKAKFNDFSDKIRNLYLYQHQKSKNFPTKH